MKLSSTPSLVFATSNKLDGNLSFKWGKKEEVIENRRSFLAKHSLRPDECVVMEVEHGEKIVVVDHDNVPSNPDKVIAAEALITNINDIALFLLTADCLPVSIYDPTHHVIALAHLGWKPTGHKLIQKVVLKLESDFKSHPKNILVHIGPCIHKDSYKLETLEQGNAPEWQPYLEKLASNETTVDLIGYNIAQLKEIGVHANNISIDPEDTRTSEKYFSHYRSVRTGEPEGRFATILALKRSQ